MVASSSGTLLKAPRRMASLDAGEARTWFSQDAEVGVKWKWKRGCFASHSLTLAPGADPEILASPGLESQ